MITWRDGVSVSRDWPELVNVAVMLGGVIFLAGFLCWPGGDKIMADKIISDSGRMISPVMIFSGSDFCARGGFAAAVSHTSEPPVAPQNFSIQ